MSVEFDPVRIGRRRRLNPIVLAVGAVLIGLALAVLKPWETNSGGLAKASATPTANPGASRATAPASSPASTRRPSTPADTEDGIPAMRWSDLVGIVGSHATAGVLAVTGHISRFTGAGADVGLAASWAPADTAAGGVGPNPGVRSGDASVLGLGVTFPAGDAPLGIRIWLQRTDGGEEWIDALPVDRPAANDPIVLVRPAAGGFIEPFEAGHYRVDLLRTGRIDRMELGIADSTGSIPAPTSWPVTESRLVPAAESDPSAVRFGLFATVDGFGVSLSVAQSRPLDEVDAWNATWVAPDAGTASSVVSAFLPRATGLGVMLTSHASVELALLSRLAPSPLVPVPPVSGGLSDIQGRTPYVVFGGPDGRALEPGVYALSVSWKDAAGLHAATWHVELRPGPVHG